MKVGSRVLWQLWLFGALSPAGREDEQVRPEVAESRLGGDVCGLSVSFFSSGKFSFACGFRCCVG